MPADDAAVAEDASIDFVQGMKTIAGAGDGCVKHGLCIYIYCCNVQ